MGFGRAVFNYWPLDDAKEQNQNFYPRQEIIKGACKQNVMTFICWSLVRFNYSPRFNQDIAKDRHARAHVNTLPR